MANISDTPYEKHGGDDSGRDSLNFTPEHHYVAAADKPQGSDPAGAKSAASEVQETDSHESQCARNGAKWAVEGGSLLGDSLPFGASSGLFRSGSDLGAEFSSAVKYSGGVRQGDTWTSDPAPGVHRCLEPHTVTLSQLHKQDEGSGRTFETQRRSHWSHDQWGG